VSLQGTDLALVSARIGVARVGAFRLGFAPDDVEGPGTVGPGEYGWQEVKPEDDGQDWELMTPWSMCAPPPVAAFTHAPDPGHVGQAVAFTDTSTPTGEITLWHWTFGDGAESDAQNPTHVYAHTGTYTVRLYVASPRGSSMAVGAVDVFTTIVRGTVTFVSGFLRICAGNVVELRNGADVVQATTVTNVVGEYAFINPAVTMLNGEAFKIYVYSPGTCAGCADTWDDSHLWAVNGTTIIYIRMAGV